MIKFLDYLKSSKCRGGVVEEVLAMNNEIQSKYFKSAPYCKDKPQSWLKFFVAELKKLGYHVRTLVMRNDNWCEVPRDRFQH